MQSSPSIQQPTESARSRVEKTLQTLPTRDMVTFACALMFALACCSALAGTGDGTFQDVYSTITTWTQGTLGRIITISAVLIGIVGGLARGSMIAFASGLGIGVGLYNMPTIVESIMQSTITHAPGTIQLIQGLSNGLS